MTVLATPPLAADAERDVQLAAKPVRRAVIPQAARVIDFGRPLTAEEFARMPETLGKQELVDGRVIEMPPVGMGHGKRQVQFASLLSAWNGEHKLGEVMVETGFILAREPDLTRGPDISFIRRETIPPDQNEDDFVEAVPEFVVEVVSKRDRPGELETKAEEYLAFGVKMVVVVNRQSRQLTIYRPETEPVVLKADQAFDGGDVLPGFSCKVSDIVG
ncbi:MAG: Uma2 family endonuclease [Planctomycetota bacterium]